MLIVNIIDGVFLVELEQREGQIPLYYYIIDMGIIIAHWSPGTTQRQDIRKSAGLIYVVPENIYLGPVFYLLSQAPILAYKL